MGETVELVNAASGVFKLLESNVKTSMGALAAALPRDVDPVAVDGDWQRSEPLHLCVCRRRQAAGPGLGVTAR